MLEQSYPCESNAVTFRSHTTLCGAMFKCAIYRHVSLNKQAYPLTRFLEGPHLRGYARSWVNPYSSSGYTTPHAARSSVITSMTSAA